MISRGSNFCLFHDWCSIVFCLIKLGLATTSHVGVGMTNVVVSFSWVMNIFLYNDETECRMCFLRFWSHVCLINVDAFLWVFFDGDFIFVL